ncbi:1,4-alpha-glucan branching enzyme [Burkholderiales bacterium]|nr:1,4-alpha-glucan branching enzyme [Burkholderiales bacterium]
MTTPITEHDVYLFREGSHGRLYDRLGAHLTQRDGVDGVHFAVWAPNAREVSVMGEWNHWHAKVDWLYPRYDSSGIWEGFVAGVRHGYAYKFHIVSQVDGSEHVKADPFASYNETPPATGSRVWELGYAWGDGQWMHTRARANALDAPMSVYELHVGSWRRVPDEGNRSMTYREMALPLAEYVVQMGFTHVELMPITEHPFYGSWGYQTTGYFAPTARYGTPQDLMYFIDVLHQHGIGVLLDWVPSHFPSDAHGLAHFDGTHLFEHADPRQGFHQEWTSHIFNYGRNEVRAFLLSSALFWLDRYHFDGLRVDAVASMLYLDYGRKAGEWVPNVYGGKENLEAISFLRMLNQAVYRDHPDTQTVAEESTSYAMVSRPVYLGGLGFGLKWNMGWMHDTLDFLHLDPVHRRFHHDRLTFSIWYAFFENFVLPLSHDEVVHGKGSLLGKMPGDAWQRFANLRLLLGYQWAHPGKKLLFMGCEFGQPGEWSHEQSLPWHLLQFAEHAGVKRWVTDCNRLLRSEPALHQVDFDIAGFQWIDANDAENGLIAFLRRGREGTAPVLVVCNLTPVPRERHRLGVPVAGRWRELANSDAAIYGGSDMGNLGAVEATAVASHGQPHSIELTLPPLSVVFLKPDNGGPGPET